MSGFPLDPSFATDLDLSSAAGVSIPGVNPFSARQLKGTLSPIDGARGNSLLARTVNGSLVDISAPQMRKYQLAIDGDDNSPPALDSLWVGMVLIVSCHVELAYLTTVGLSGRTPVPGSSWEDGAYTRYRPQLTMMVVDLQIERDEWDAAVRWHLTLEEV